MTVRFFLFAIALFASASCSAAAQYRELEVLREILRECGCLLADMPEELLDTRTVDHALMSTGDDFVVAFWTSLDLAAPDPLWVVGGNVRSGRWKKVALPREEGPGPLQGFMRRGDYLFLMRRFAIDTSTINVLTPSLDLRGTIYGNVRDVWPNGLVVYDVHQPRFGPHREAWALFDPQSGEERPMYPPEICQPVRCEYTDRLIKAGGGPVPFIQAYVMHDAPLNWPQRILAFIARFKQEYSMVTPPGWTEELDVMVVCDSLDRIQTSRCQETPLAAWRAAFPGVADEALPALAAAHPHRVRP